jgi:ADP-heptose:LPS heptosyltransferase
MKLSERFSKFIRSHMWQILFILLKLFSRLLPSGRPAQDSGSSALIIHPFGSVGDTVLIVPLIEKLKSDFKYYEIDLLIQTNMAPLFVGHPDLRHIHAYDPNSKRIKPLKVISNFVTLTFFFARNLKSIKYELSLSTRWDSDVLGMFVRFASHLVGAKSRCAYSMTVDGGHRGVDRFQTHLAFGGAGEHQLLRHLRLSDRAGLTSSQEAEELKIRVPMPWLQTIALEHAAAATEIIHARTDWNATAAYAAISPGATSMLRKWPTEHITALSGMIREQLGLNILIIGSAADAAYCKDVVSAIGPSAISIAGQTNVRELIAIIHQAALFVGNDSGPAHIAGAVGTQTVVVSPFPLSCNQDHPNSPVRFRPCGPRVSVVQPSSPLPPCTNVCVQIAPHCIAQVTPRVVFSSIESLRRAARL